MLVSVGALRLYVNSPAPKVRQVVAQFQRESGDVKAATPERQFSKGAMTTSLAPWAGRLARFNISLKWPEFRRFFGFFSNSLRGMAGLGTLKGQQENRRLALRSMASPAPLPVRAATRHATLTKN